MENISGFGTQINLIASNTYPIGVNLTQFADDSDPIDFPVLQIADAAMGLNGDLIPWSKANPIKVTLNIIPNSLDDETLSILLEANRVGRGKTGAQDTITMAVLYPDGRYVTLIEGVITEGMPNLSIASAGRMKTKTYNFVFENQAGI